MTAPGKPRAVPQTEPSGAGATEAARADSGEVEGDAQETRRVEHVRVHRPDGERGEPEEQ